MDGITVVIGGFKGSLASYIGHVKTTEVESERLSSIKSTKFRAIVPTSRGDKVFNPLKGIHKASREKVLNFIDSMFQELGDCPGISIELKDLILGYNLPSSNADKIIYKKTARKLENIGVIKNIKGVGKKDFELVNVSLHKFMDTVPSKVVKVSEKEPEVVKIKTKMETTLDLIGIMVKSEGFQAAAWEIDGYLVSVNKKI